MAIPLTRRIREVWANEGLAAVAARGARRVRRFLFTREEYVVFAADLIKTRDAIPTEAEVEWLLVDSPEAAGSLRRARLAAGGIACCAWSGDTLLHVSWAARRSPAGIDPLERYVDLSRCAYIGDCWTAPEARGLGLYPEALRRLLELLADEGQHRTVLTVEKSNEASLRGVAKASFCQVGVGARVSVLGRSWWKGSAIG